MELTLKDAKKYLKAYKRAYKMNFENVSLVYHSFEQPIRRKNIPRRTNCLLH